MKKIALIVMLCLSIASLSGHEKAGDIQTGAAATLQESPEAVVQRQLDAYNARDIDAFVVTFAEDVEVYNSRGELTMKGRQQLRNGYETMFKNTPNLHCNIEKRIVINNKVIDEERVIAGDRKIHAVAIYEVVDGKIRKVNFVD